MRITTLCLVGLVVTLTCVSSNARESAPASSVDAAPFLMFTMQRVGLPDGKGTVGYVVREIALADSSGWTRVPGLVTLDCPLPGEGIWRTPVIEGLCIELPWTSIEDGRSGWLLKTARAPQSMLQIPEQGWTRKCFLAGQAEPKPKAIQLMFWEDGKQARQLLLRGKTAKSMLGKRAPWKSVKAPSPPETIVLVGSWSTLQVTSTPLRIVDEDAD